MFPITIDVIAADRTRRLEGFATRSRRRFRSDASDDNHADRPVRHHRVSSTAFGH